MPLAFSKEECQKIRNALLENACLYVQTRSVSDITVDELAKSVGISKGAFYKFFSSKEQLFYTLLRQMHNKIYGPALDLLKTSSNDPSFVLTKAILEACKLLDDSKYARFYEEDAKRVLDSIPEEDKKKQIEEETELFRLFLKQYDCKVDEELAMNALRSLIYTTSMRKELGEDYATILEWMVNGICNKLF